MECPTCNQQFNETERVPRNLTCGHTFCECCLLQIEINRLNFCPICRTEIPKNIRASKLPKNYLVLEVVNKQMKLQQVHSFCEFHNEEPLRFFCNTCMRLICAECIVDHCGHQFVKKDDSVFVLKQKTECLVMSLQGVMGEVNNVYMEGKEAIKKLKEKEKDDMHFIDLQFDKILESLDEKKKSLKSEYRKYSHLEKEKVKSDIKNISNFLEDLQLQVVEGGEMLSEFDKMTDSDMKSTNVNAKIDKLKDILDDTKEKADKLKPVSLKLPELIFYGADTMKRIKKMGFIYYENSFMANRKICFFGDKNKIMTYEVDKSKWELKKLDNRAFEFNYYSAAVTLPTGEALVTGGGSSGAVYLYSKGKFFVKQSMLQMRKEHAAVYLAGYVYVIGGFDGTQNLFMKTCERYNMERDKWKQVSSLNTARCAFSASPINSRFIYIFGGYDGLRRLDSVERYDRIKDSWIFCNFKLKLPLSNCASFNSGHDQIVILGGGFSSGFSLNVDKVNIQKGEWLSLAPMNDGRDLRNKIVYLDGYAYTAGGYNFKAEKYDCTKDKWFTLPNYPIGDNLDSWSCALIYDTLAKAPNSNEEEGNSYDISGDYLSSSDHEEAKRESISGKNRMRLD